MTNIVKKGREHINYGGRIPPESRRILAVLDFTCPQCTCEFETDEYEKERLLVTAEASYYRTKCPWCGARIHFDENYIKRSCPEFF